MRDADAPRIDEHSFVHCNTGIVFSRLDDDLLAMDERAGYCYSLNVSASRIWELIRTPITLGNLCAALSREFEVDPATCKKDVAELLDELLDAGLIRVSPHAPEV